MEPKKLISIGICDFYIVPFTEKDEEMMKAMIRKFLKSTEEGIQ